MSLSKLAIVAIGLILVIVSSNLNWGQDHWKEIIEADAKGYYAYLPAIFIYQDLNFEFFEEIEEEKYYNERLHYDYRAIANGKVFNKYYCGTALAELPFFLIAHALSDAFGFEMDGYSKLYLIFINIAAIFYVLIGLLYVDATLNLYDIGETKRIITLVAGVFGTNLFYYTVGEPGMSHVFSFAFVSMFLYFAKKYFGSPHDRELFILAVILAIIILIRPLNGLVVLILPFIAESFDSLKRGIVRAMQTYKVLMWSALCFLLIVFVQLFIYKISTGNFLVYSYGSERFNFLTPHFIDILFSYKKGLFVYTPFFLVSLAGAYFVWKESRFQFYSLIGFFVLITYVFSSWWMWYYGGSFSSRVYVEYIPVFMIVLAIALSRIGARPLRNLYLSILFLVVLLCQIQTYQYRHDEIHWSEMTKEKYWDVFLRLDRAIK